MKQVSIKDVLAMLEEGKTRKEINEYYELNTASQKALWNHSKLKGKRKKLNVVEIEIVDDTEENNVNTVVENVENVAEEVESKAYNIIYDEDNVKVTENNYQHVDNF